eukprot:GILJ01010692.1.p1 GENE.GILJ01010692.1~~GILJ01010692.1.p1  ORF type:complete len:1228 (-),score=177.81 GILJ01010692.1:124-3402(-)
MDRQIGRDHLFKRSILVTKAWCLYESHLLGSQHALLATYSVELLILFILNAFHAELHTPLQVFMKFLSYFSDFDWKTSAITVCGPLRISSIVNKKLEDELIDLSYEEMAVMEADDEDESFDLLLSPTVVANYRTKYEPIYRRTGPMAVKKPFPVKFMNVVDPLLSWNNLGRSVSSNSFYRIQQALLLGHEKFSDIVAAAGSQTSEEIHRAIRRFFRNSWPMQQDSVTDSMAPFFPPRLLVPASQYRLNSLSTAISPVNHHTNSLTVLPDGIGSTTEPNSESSDEPRKKSVSAVAPVMSPRLPSFSDAATIVVSVAFPPCSPTKHQTPKVTALPHSPSLSALSLSPPPPLRIAEFSSTDKPAGIVADIVSDIVTNAASTAVADSQVSSSASSSSSSLAHTTTSYPPPSMNHGGIGSSSSSAFFRAENRSSSSMGSSESDVHIYDSNTCIKDHSSGCGVCERCVSIQLSRSSTDNSAMDLDAATDCIASCSSRSVTPPLPSPSTFANPTPYEFSHAGMSISTSLSPSPAPTYSQPNSTSSSSQNSPQLKPVPSPLFKTQPTLPSFQAISHSNNSIRSPFLAGQPALLPGPLFMLPAFSLTETVAEDVLESDLDGIKRDLNLIVCMSPNPPLKRKQKAPDFAMLRDPMPQHGYYREESKEHRTQQSHDRSGKREFARKSTSLPATPAPFQTVVNGTPGALTRVKREPPVDAASADLDWRAAKPDQNSGESHWLKTFRETNLQARLYAAGVAGTNTSMNTGATGTGTVPASGRDSSSASKVNRDRPKENRPMYRQEMEYTNWRAERDKERDRGREREGNRGSRDTFMRGDKNEGGKWRSWQVNAQLRDQELLYGSQDVRELDNVSVQDTTESVHSEDISTQDGTGSLAEDDKFSTAGNGRNDRGWGPSQNENQSSSQSSSNVNRPIHMPLSYNAVLSSNVSTTGNASNQGGGSKRESHTNSDPSQKPDSNIVWGTFNSAVYSDSNVNSSSASRTVSGTTRSDRRVDSEKDQRERERPKERGSERHRDTRRERERDVVSHTKEVEPRSSKNKVEDDNAWHTVGRKKTGKKSGTPDTTPPRGSKQSDWKKSSSKHESR